MYRAKRLIPLAIIMLTTALVLSGCFPKIAAKPTRTPVTLRFGYREHTVDLENLFAQFHEENPWVTIEPVTLDRFNYSDIESAVRTGTIDVFKDTTGALALAQEGLLHQLDDMQVAAWEEIRDDYYDSTWEALTVDGQLWGVPAALDMMVAYVNMDQAKALNVSVPQKEWDLFDFVDLATQMNYPEGTPYSSSVKIFGLCTDPRQIDPVIFVYLYGGSIVDDLSNPTRPTLDDARTIEAVDWYVRLFTDYQVAPDVATIGTAFRRGGVFEAAARGRCGTWLGWLSGRGGQDMGFEWGLDYRILPMPSAAVDFGMGDVEGYYVTKNCADPAAAIELIRFMSDHIESAGTKLPPRQSLVNSDDFETLVGEELAAQIRDLSGNLVIIPTDAMGQLEGVGGQLINIVQLCITQDISSAGPLQEAQREMEYVFESQ